jgi:hypothetical protein
MMIAYRFTFNTQGAAKMEAIYNFEGIGGVLLPVCKPAGL